MESARQRYQNDPAYKQLVDMMEHFIHRAEFTPSEMREAAILASINYEMIRVRRYQIPMTKELHTRLEELHVIIDKDADATLRPW